MADVPEHLGPLDQLADQLYAQDPTAFVASREALVKELKAANREADAATLKAMRKPSLAAWALNILVREERVQVDALLAVGDELRHAQRTLSANDLRALTTQRHRVVRTVALRAGTLAADFGHPLSASALDQVTQSLDAAMTDSGCASALVEGHLTTELSYAGLGETGSQSPSLTVVGAKESTEGTKSRSARRSQIAAAKRDVIETSRERAESAERRDRAKNEAAAANLRAAAAEETLAAVQAEWEAAKAAEMAAERALVLADKTYDRAVDRAAVAEETLARLTADR